MRLDHQCGGAQVLKRETPFQSAYIDMIQSISRRRDYLVFDTARRADEGNFRIRLHYFNFIRYGDGGINMTSRSSACH